MSPRPFNAPNLEAMSRLLPAFEFSALIISNELSAVYAANQRSLDRMVAIKVLSPHVSENPKFRESFEVVARTMAKLNHPNLIGVYDSGLVDQMLYFVMEFIPGKSLERSAQGHCVERAQALRLIEGICKGLSHAHDHGIVHGAVEPSIILLNQKAEPKIGNFGFNHLTNVDGAAAVEGNPTIAPEVAAGGTVNPRSDIYAVGAILYQLLTGQPHRVDAPLPSTLSSCGRALDVIWGKATHPDPVQRYAGMRTLLNEISALTQPQRGGVEKMAESTPGSIGRLAPQRSPVAVSPPTTSARPVVPPRESFNWQIILNLLLLVAVGFVGKYTWEKHKAREAQGGGVILVPATGNGESDENARAEAARLAVENDMRNRKNPDAHPHPQPPVPRVESPEDSLARLRGSLASGQRNEMPAGSVRQGENDYFLVNKPMSWPEATWFAEQHGAHLAIPSVGADLKWLVDHVTCKQAVWIGAARNGSKTWALADGTLWKPFKEPSGTGSYVGVDKDGFLRAASIKIRLPFVIQWHRDGKNPGALEALLATTRQSLGTPQPVYPPGTHTFENRSFLIVCRPIRWSDAVDLAKQSGGNLAVPATVGEISLLEEFTNDVDARNGIWLGGSMKGKQWAWITGEPWKAAKWAKDAATDVANTAVIIQPSKNWNCLNISSMASGFIIEWSADAALKTNN